MSDLGYVYEKQPGDFVYSRYPRDVVIGGTQYPKVFFVNAPTEELKAINIYRVKEYNRIDQRREDLVNTTTVVDTDDLAVLTEVGRPNASKRHEAEYDYVQGVERARIEENIGDNSEILRVVVVAADSNGSGDNIARAALSRLQWMDLTHRHSWALRSKIRNDQPYDPDSGWPPITW